MMDDVSSETCLKNELQKHRVVHQRDTLLCAATFQVSTFLSKTMFERFCSDVDLLNDYIIKMSNEKLTISIRINKNVRTVGH